MKVGKYTVFIMAVACISEALGMGLLGRTRPEPRAVTCELNSAQEKNRGGEGLRSAPGSDDWLASCSTENGERYQQTIDASIGSVIQIVDAPGEVFNSC